MTTDTKAQPMTDEELAFLRGEIEDRNGQITTYTARRLLATIARDREARERAENVVKMAGNWPQTLAKLEEALSTFPAGRTFMRGWDAAERDRGEARAKVEWLRYELRLARLDVGHWLDKYNALKNKAFADRDALRARVAELEAALRSYANPRHWNARIFGLHDTDDEVDARMEKVGGALARAALASPSAPATAVEPGADRTSGKCGSCYGTGNLLFNEKSDYAPCPYCAYATSPHAARRCTGDVRDVRWNRGGHGW